MYDYIHGCVAPFSNELKNNSFIEIYKLKAVELYLNGLSSLIKNINIFDTGFRTLYSLIHLSDLTIEPNTARWDYHSLHISQLFYLSDMIKNDNLLFNTNNTVLVNKLLKVANRWLDYSKGKWNQNSQIVHNFLI